MNLNLPPKKGLVKFRLVRHSGFVPGIGVVFSYDIQKRKSFLFFEWWDTVDAGYSNLAKARTVTLSLMAQEGQPKTKIVSEM